FRIKFSRAHKALTNPIQTIQEIMQSALAEINSAATLADLEKVRVAALGRKGELAGISKTFGSMQPEDRARAGQLLNEAKATLEKAVDDRKATLAGSESDEKLKAEWIDLTIPPEGIEPGHIHPVTQVQDEIERLFISMGFRVLDGPEVESDYYNFDALNIPPEHPARDMQDTF